MVDAGFLTRLLKDDVLYIENLMMIPNKSRVSVPFKLKPVQLDYAQSTTNRDIILKAGQLGFTSIVMALFLKENITIPNTTSVVIAHEEFLTSRLLEKCRVFEKSLPLELKPKLTHDSQYAMMWEDINSAFYISSARKFIAGRGERIDNLLCSEIAFWPDADRIMTEVEPRARRIVLESTPNGEDLYFYPKVQDTIEGQKTGRSIYNLHVYPWWLEPDYKLPMGSEDALPIDRVSPLEYSEEEMNLVNLYGLTEEQIRWRRVNISKLKAMFWQEFLEDNVSCFTRVANSTFDLTTLDGMAKICYPAPYTYQNARIWYPPYEGGIFIVGADPTIGAEDKAAATVWDLKNMRHCATLTGVIEPVPFARMLRELGHYYNTAMLVVENNNPGIAVLAELLGQYGEKGYPYIYYMRDVVTGRYSSTPGWRTDRKTKPYLFQQTGRLMTTDPDGTFGLETYDLDLVRELKGFRSFGMDIDSMGEDDIAMSAMIALACREAVPTAKKGLVGTAGWKGKAWG